MENNKLLISILVPIYGVEKYIGNCAKSLFEQTYENIEFIFINDSTKDKSMEVLKNILEKYPHRKAQTKIINHEYNKGLSGARNTGVEHFTGDYLMHVDGDDFLELDAVESLVNFVSKKTVDIVVFDYYSVTKSGKKIVQSVFAEKNEMIKNILLKSFAPSIWNKLYSARLYRSGFDSLSVQGINHGEDYATTPRLLYYAQSIAKLDKALYNYVQYNEGSYTKNLSISSVNSMVMADTKLFDFFLHKQINGIKIPDILYVAKLRTKIALFKRCGLDLYSSVCALYTDIPLQYERALSTADKVILVLARRKWLKFIYSYTRIGLKIKRLLSK